MIFQRFKEKDKFTKMITEFGISRSTVSFKIMINKYKYQEVLIGSWALNKYFKLKNSSLSLYFLKKNMRIIEKICKEIAREFKSSYLNLTRFLLLIQIRWSSFN